MEGGLRKRLVAAATLALACVCLAARAASPDLSGVWLPVAELSTPWPANLPLTDAARARLAAFNPDRDEPAGFCMPLGTPRNTLSGTSPLEVLQTDTRVYFVFQPNLLNAETRRVYLDGRPLPAAEDRIPTWLGTSRGHWEGAALVAETIDMEPQAILNGAGLSHGGALKVRERWQVVPDAKRGRLLVDDIELDDPESFTLPVRLKRVFAWAPDAQLAEGQCSERLWIDTLWRFRLAEHAAAAAARAKNAGDASKPAAEAPR
jgi:hypothetical protein